MSVTWHPRPKDELFLDLKLPAALARIDRAEAQRIAALVALRGLGRVAPNPLVGAVLVDREHRFLGAGAHEQVGSHHAEINAFLAYEAIKRETPQADLAGGILYVTLEPCAHQSRTPACAPQVAKSGVARVVYGAVDPNPAVNGRGAAILEAARIATEHDITWQPACEALAEVFLWNVRRKTPFVALKAALSLDGAIAKRGDQRVWLTGPRARAYGHFLRLHYDAIAIGQGTLLADDPTLDARDALVNGPTPLRVVLDPDGAALRSRPGAAWKILATQPEKVLWIHGKDADLGTGKAALDRLGAKRLGLDSKSGTTIEPKVILAALAERGVTSLLLEGGAGLYGSFLDAGAVNRLHLFQSPKLLGGAKATGWTSQVDLQAAPGSATEITPLGDDWLVEMAIDPSNAFGKI